MKIFHDMRSDKKGGDRQTDMDIQTDQREMLELLYATNNIALPHLQCMSLVLGP